MLEFVHPRYLWLLLAVPAALLFWGIGIWYHHRMRRRFGNLENLEEISRISWSGQGWLRGGLYAASLIAMAFGLAYPQVMSRELRPVPMPTDVVFMLDVSPSMYAKDMDPHRLGHAQQIIQRFILQKQPDDRYALVTFTFYSVVSSYLTRDPQAFLVFFDHLNQIEEPGWGSNMGAGLVNGLRVFDADDQVNPQAKQKRRRVMVMIGDGDDNVGQWQGPLVEAVGRKLKVYSFGLGSATGAPVPLLRSPTGYTLKYATLMTGERLISKAGARTLRDLSERTGARFYRGEDVKQVDAALDEILGSGRPTAGYEANPIRLDLYFYFLFAAFVFMLAGIFL